MPAILDTPVGCRIVQDTLENASTLVGKPSLSSVLLSKGDYSC